eukprot:CAMPEP_0185851158 /NCGR_PEP_ID=MMETSP1354-20130828/6629_1 /TAXON_ID=708628 /ORGANISM="Erythrolobus madagascarensis, Strain CCMP3276" /LENGTH=209 /DNA_ID=CAMNT_0028552053 /DNA_START=263 /DNA_END=892 /DNA_ORIENTATION=-
MLSGKRKRGDQSDDNKREGTNERELDDWTRESSEALRLAKLLESKKPLVLENGQQRKRKTARRKRDIETRTADSSGSVEVFEINGEEARRTWELGVQYSHDRSEQFYGELLETSLQQAEHETAKLSEKVQELKERADQFEARLQKLGMLSGGTNFGSQPSMMQNARSKELTVPVTLLGVSDVVGFLQDGLLAQGLDEILEILRQDYDSQ